MREVTVVDQISESAIQPKANVAPDRVGVSVIIPARNEERFLDQCLESLCRLDYPRQAFEVLVVDNGSSDRTLEIARRFSSLLNLQILQKAGVPISAVRNLGAAAARGEVFAFLDADCRVPLTWLTEATALLGTERVGVVGAEPLVPENTSWIPRAWLGRRPAARRGEVSSLGAANLVVRRENFFSVGGFDETLETNEDCEFCYRIRAAGLSVQESPQLAVVHLRVPRTLRDFYRKERWHGRHVFKVFLRELPGLANARAVFFALYTLAGLFGLVWGTALALIARRFGPIQVFMLATILPPLLLSARAAMAYKRWRYLFALFALYLTYGVARAICILDLRTWLTGAQPSHGTRAAADSVRAQTPTPQRARASSSPPE